MPRSRTQGWGDYIIKYKLITLIVCPYTLDTSNPCWYDVDLVCYIRLKLMGNQVLFSGWSIYVYLSGLRRRQQLFFLLSSVHQYHFGTRNEVRQLAINNPPRLRRFFVSAQTISRGAKHRDVQVSLEAGCWLLVATIASYVTIEMV